MISGSNNEYFNMEDNIIRFANKSDYNSIVTLWAKSFFDEDFARWYFEKLYREENTLVYIQGDKIVSMLARIPFRIKGLGEVTYIYGACTDPDYRKRGIMKRLLMYSEELDIKLNKAAIILIPENESLFEFYKKCGFKDYFYKYLRSDYEEDYNLEVNKNLLISNNNDKTLINKRFLNVKFENVTEMKPNFYKIIYNITELYKTININNMEVIRDTSYYERLIDMYNKNGGKMYVAYDDIEGIYGYTFGYEEDGYKVTELVYKNLEVRQFIINKLKELYNDYIILNELQGNSKIKYGFIKLLQKNENVNKIIISLMYD